MDNLKPQILKPRGGLPVVMIKKKQQKQWMFKTLLSIVNQTSMLEAWEYINGLILI